MTEPLPDELRVRAALTSHGKDVAGATDVGRARRRNEDAYWIDSQARFALLADGLGGLPDGDIASRVAVLAAVKVLENRLSEGAGSAHQESSPSARLHHLGMALGDAFEAAQASVLAQPKSTSSEVSMATTLIGAVIENNMVVLVHVGDVRGYVWRAGSPVLVTADHSQVGELVRDGLLTRDQARSRPDRNIVTEVLGVPEGYRADIDVLELEEGDVVVLCSDGLWEAVEEDGMARLLEHSGSASEAASWLVQAANGAGGRDNITVIVLRHAASVAAGVPG